MIEDVSRGSRKDTSAPAKLKAEHTVRHVYIRHNQSSRDFNDNDTALQLFSSRKVDFTIHLKIYDENSKENNWKRFIAPDLICCGESGDGWHLANTRYSQSVICNVSLFCRYILIFLRYITYYLNKLHNLNYAQFFFNLSLTRYNYYLAMLQILFHT